MTEVNKKMLLVIATRLRRITEQQVGVSDFELLGMVQTIRDVVKEEGKDVLIAKTKA